MIAVTVNEAFFHCTKCVVRSGLWSSEAEHDELVSLGAAIIKHAKLDISLEEADAMLVEDETSGLY